MDAAGRFEVHTVLVKITENANTSRRSAKKVKHHRCPDIDSNAKFRRNAKCRDVKTVYRMHSSFFVKESSAVIA